MRLYFLPAVISVFLALAPAARAQTAPKIVPPEWIPPLAPSITSTLDRLKAANTQTEMNLLSREVAEMTDAQLFVAYVRLYEKLPAKARAALLEEQQKWLKARKKAAAAGVESEGGSLAPLEANNAAVTFTEKRLKELRTRLQALQKDAD